MAAIVIDSQNHTEMIDITDKVQSLIPENFKSGICHLFCLHTTAGLTINENGDPDVVQDILQFMSEAVPWSNKVYRHFEGNSAAHIKSTVFGPSLTVPVENGQLLLGAWQSIYFCEFDGPRNGRKIDARFVKSI